ncbi:hypothetical protein BFP72_12195 [Reichenbachiella sp. 5M10]|uniref:hypothetical protein n=1 Tax=Reichenbachiella sp. 5M10 TaxID=1889772 RepID=UPI000C15C2F9|nr:hypothetical protein [Reichenbachiella sp. 5M10]PIB36101.1 hypothetical protein BFP72_12195 [Reichenbachiella sp. 5M10]
MKRKIVCSACALLLSIGICAQGDPHNESGFIVTPDEVIYGDVTINVDGNDLMIRTGRHIYNWTADKVTKVAVINPETGMTEKYVSGTFGMNEQNFFFEVLSDGKIVLLYREGLKFSKYDELEYAPYYVLMDGVIHSLAQSKKEFMGLFAEHHENEMSDFIKEKGIDLKNRSDLTKAFDYYNTKFGGSESYFVTNR